MISILVILHGIWIVQDQAPMAQTDAYGLLTQNLRAVQDLRISRPGELTFFVGNLSLQGRPPLYQLLSFPVLLAGGWSEDAAQIFNLFFLVVLVLSVYGATRMLADRPTALLAALLAAAYPPIVHILHVYRPHAALPAWVALTLWLLLGFLREASIRRAWLLCGVLAVGALIHPVYVFFVVVPVPVAVLRGLYRKVAYQDGEASKPLSLRRLVRHPILWRGLVPGVLLLALAVGGWYLSRGRSLFVAHGSWTGESVAQYRGAAEIALGFPDVPVGLGWYFHTSPWALSWPLALLAAFGLLFLVVKPRWSHALLLTHCVGGYLIQASFDTAYAWWRIAPLLPALAVASSLFLHRIGFSGVRRMVRIGVGGIAVYVFLTVLWGPPGGSRTAAKLLGSPLDGSTCQSRARSAGAFCPAPPLADVWPVEDVLRAVTTRGSCAEDRPCVLTVVPSYGLSTALFRYHQLRQVPRTPLRILHVGSPAWGGGYRFEALVENDFLLFPDRRLAGNRYLKATSAFLIEPSPLFRRSHRILRRFSAEGNGTLVLLQRTKPLTLAEAQEVRVALQLPEKYLTSYKSLLFRLRAPQTPRKALELYRRLMPEMSARERYATLLEVAKEVRGESPEAALEILQEAAQVRPRATRPHVMQARIHMEQGRLQEAVDKMEHAVELDPSDEKVMELLERMREGSRAPAE